MKLIFVYNADSGFANALMDIGHKVISPDTYQCNLCGLTFGVFSEQKKWKQFREESDTQMEFLHRDEFERKYNQQFEYPIVFKQDQDLEIAISKTDLESIPTLDRLIEQIRKILSHD